MMSSNDPTFQAVSPEQNVAYWQKLYNDERQKVRNLEHDCETMKQILDDKDDELMEMAGTVDALEEDFRSLEVEIEHLQGELDDLRHGDGES